MLSSQETAFNLKFISRNEKLWGVSHSASSATKRAKKATKISLQCTSFSVAHLRNTQLSAGSRGLGMSEGIDTPHGVPCPTHLQPPSLGERSCLKRLRLRWFHCGRRMSPLTRMSWKVFECLRAFSTEKKPRRSPSWVLFT